MPDFSFTDLLYRPIFSRLAVPAILNLASGRTIDTLPDGTPLMSLDKTQGIDLTGSGSTLETLKPVAELMSADMLALGIGRGDLVKADVTINTRLWHVIATKHNQSQFGPSDGTMWLILEGDEDT